MHRTTQWKYQKHVTQFNHQKGTTERIPENIKVRKQRKNPNQNRDIFQQNIDVDLFVPAVMIPPSRPNVTRLNDESVMVSWSHDNQGLPIRFFKVSVLI